MQALRRFEDRVVLITGAASGIGHATALRVAGEGGRVYCVDVQPDAAEETSRQASELGAEVAAAVCDVSEEDSVARSVGDCVARFGRLDALCHVAGILRFAHTHEMDTATWRLIQSINIDGTFFVCRAALPHLVATKGNIVNVSSIAAKAGFAYAAAYAASKGAVLSFTKALAVEYGKQGVRVNSVCPGSITTPMIQEITALPKDADRQLVLRQMPLDQPRGPETVASLIAFLASDDAAHINGEDILVDGGALA